MSELQENAGDNINQERVMNFPTPFPALNPLGVLLPSVDQNYTLNLDSTLEDESEPAADTLDDSIAYESLSTDFNDIKTDFIKLNDEQRDIVMHICYLYKNINRNDSGEIIDENPKIILQGPAGTGKSTVINFLEKFITWEENKTSDSPQKVKLLKCAFTGKAATNIKGSTLHGSFSISFKFQDLSEESLASKRYFLDDCIFFVCDEISMVGENMMRRVNARLQEIFRNNKLYGNRFVLLAGDIYQIDPVFDCRMYPNSEYWTCCKFYELTENMRQRNDAQFITALNNFRHSQMTEEDIELFKGRIIESIDQLPNPNSIIHLYYLNKHVIKYNTYKIENSNGIEEIVEACIRKKMQVYNLRVKVGLRYMITFNIDVSDGLANGTTGVVKHFDHDATGSVTAIWMDCHSGKIGNNTRRTYLNGQTKPGFENWVPILRSKISRNRFPLIAAEAITVHKSQGQTYEDGVCIHFTDDPKDRLRSDISLQYVALSRVTRLENLYIIGRIEFSNGESTKLKKRGDEINRLREEQKLKLAFETFDDKSGDVIIYLNTGFTFYEHYQFITADKWYRNASLLIFSETNTIATDQIAIPNFELVFRSDTETISRSGGGIFCYKQGNKSINVVDSVQVDNNRNCLTLFLYETIYIITGVKRDLTDDSFKSAVENLIFKYIKGERCIFFIGDFDINPNTTPLIDFLNDQNFKKELSCDIFAANGETRCDAVFTRNFDIKPDHIGFYQYIPSSHNSIYVHLPPVDDQKHSGDITKPGPSSAITVYPLFELNESMFGSLVL